MLVREEVFMRVGWLVVGVVAMVIGLIWALQGVGILGGSAMSGRSIFVVIGLVVIVIGAVVAIRGMRRRPTPNA